MWFGSWIDRAIPEFPQVREAVHKKEDAMITTERMGQDEDEDEG